MEVESESFPGLLHLHLPLSLESEKEIEVVSLKWSWKRRHINGEGQGRTRGIYLESWSHRWDQDIRKPRAQHRDQDGPQGI